MAKANQQAAFANNSASKNSIETQVDILAPAKINLHLEILGKRSDGFHELETVMTTVSLFDQLRFIPRDDDRIELSIVNHMHLANDCIQATSTAPPEAIPLDERNLVVQALLRLRTEGPSNRKFGCNVLLQKNVPSSAGLGGASSNAAAAIRAGCQLWNLKIPFSRQLEIAAALGSDIPFFLYGGTAVCRGRGEQVQALTASCGLPLVIAKPATGLSTPRVFKQCRPSHEPSVATPMIQSVRHSRPQEIAGLLFNRLQRFAVELNPEITAVATAFSKTNCLGHQMSGSGSSYFGIFSSNRAAHQAAQALSARLPQVRIFCAHTFGRLPPVASHSLNSSA